MSSWVILAAPLLIAAVALSVAFVGCDTVLGLTAVGAEYRDEVMGESSLVSYWRLGEAPGATAADDSKNGNAGKYNGSITLGVPGLLNPLANTENDTAAKFDGASGYVSVPFKAALNPAKFTIEVLVQIYGGDGTIRSIVSSRHVEPLTKHVFGYGVQVSKQNRWEGFAGDGVTTAFKTATVGPVNAVEVGAGQPGGPYYVALTYDGTTLTLYVNPVDPTPTSSDQVASVPVAIMPNTGNELRIGAGENEGPPQLFFNGVLDEVAIYNAALDYNTIQSHLAVALLGLKPQ